MREAKVAAEKSLQVLETATTKEVARLRRRCKAAERDVTLARKTLRTTESVDKKGGHLLALKNALRYNIASITSTYYVFVAVVVAGEMQREVTAKRGQLDSLQTKIHWLEECLDAALRVSCH